MNVSEMLNGMSPKNKRLLYVAGIVGGVVMALTLMAPDRSGFGMNEKPVIHLLTDEDTSKMTLQMLAAKIDSLKSDNGKLQRQMDQMRMRGRVGAANGSSTVNKGMKAEMKRMKADWNNSRRVTAQLMKRLNMLENSGLEVDEEMIADAVEKKIGKSGIKTTYQNSPVTPVDSSMFEVVDKQSDAEEVVKKVVKKVEVKEPPRVAAPDPMEYFRRSPLPNKRDEVFTAPGGPSGSSQVSTSKDSSDGSSESLSIRTIASGDVTVSKASRKEHEIVTKRKAQKRQEEKENSKSVEMYLPAGSIVEGVVLSGMDAPTNKTARKNPVPFLVRIMKEAVLPSRYHANIKSCHLLASGYGELSSERAMIRGETISCIFNDGRVVESNFDSYAVGSDSKAGIRGRVVSKEGQMIGRALLSGFASGMAEAFDGIEEPELSLNGVGVEPNLFRTGAVGGASTALDKVAEYYIELAETISPIIEVNSGQTVSFIVTRGVNLKQ